ncbi:MAG: DUF4405 domain-containing protein [Candidatus Aenigmarchaeota archaeon]|nr:DUF4405 domain-containing protein [Candidatus Aenigmarchaeota archaeon]
MVNKAKLNYVIDVGLGISFLSVFITGIVKFPDFLQYFGITRRYIPVQGLSTIHDWSGIIMGILVLVHLVLHWKWIVCMTKSFFRRGGKCGR